ncbi:hypothetical protein ES705_34512 [subsurface metagenome]
MSLEENRYGGVDLEKLRDTLRGLDSFYLALVWEFAQYLLRIQTRIEEYKAANRS